MCVIIHNWDLFARMSRVMRVTAHEPSTVENQWFQDGALNYANSLLRKSEMPKNVPQGLNQFIILLHLRHN